MKRTNYYIPIIIVIGLLVFMNVFLMEHNVDFQLVEKAPNGNSMFNIIRCELLENDKELTSHLKWYSKKPLVKAFGDSVRWRKECNIREKEYKFLNQLKKNGAFDFDSYHYLICYGCEIKRMCHSLYNTYFRDETVFYPAKRNGRNLLCIQYANGMNTFDFDFKEPNSSIGNGYIYVYRINNNENVQLRGE
jgi:hypothetical protein